MAIWPFKRRKRSSSIAEGKRPAIENDDPGVIARAQRVPSPTAGNPSRPRSRCDSRSHSPTTRNAHAHLHRQNNSTTSNNKTTATTTRATTTARKTTTTRTTTTPIPPRAIATPTPRTHRDIPSRANSSMAQGPKPQPPKQPRKPLWRGTSSYPVSPPVMAADDASSVSSARPHKQSSFLRKLSKRRPEKPKTQPPISYHQPPQLARQDSRGQRDRSLPDRPPSPVSTAPRTSLESQVSSRAYKIRKLDVFSPHPTLHYDECSSSPTSSRSMDFGGNPRLTPSRSNSRRTNSRTQTWRYKAPLIYEENVNGHRPRVDDLADELDAKGLREAMERDQRRRERKKREYEEQLRVRLERKAARQARGEDSDDDMGGPSHTTEHETEQPQFHNYHDDEDYRIPDATVCYPNSGNQTPLSWTNMDQPAEYNPARGSQFEPRTGVVTPVSMEDDVKQETQQEEQGQTQEQNSRASSGPHLDAQENSSDERLDEAPAAAAAASQAPPPTRAKTSAWTSFIKRATAARIRKEHNARSAQAALQPAVAAGEGEGHSAGLPASRPASAPRTAEFRDVEELRHQQGQTPGRHISNELALAMTAVATGHLHDDSGYQENDYNDEYEDELRDAVHPTPPLAPYQNGSTISSRDTLSPLGLGLRSGVPKGQSPLFDESKDSPSPTIPIPHARTPSAQRYSPSFNRYSPGGQSPEHGPRSLMSSSLASIDSEGSWLSGKITGRQPVPHLSPLRTSASSMRKRYLELDGDINMGDDDYFSGVGQANADDFDLDQDPPTARLDLDDTDEDLDEDGDYRSIASDNERNMWREGMAKIQMERSTQMSRQGILVDYVDQPTSPDDAVFSTPLEHPFMRSLSTRSDVYSTPLEHPAARRHPSNRRGR